MTTSPADRLQTRIFGASLIGAPLLLLLSSLFHAMDNDIGAGIVGFYAFLLYIPASSALATLLAERMPRWSIASRWLLVFACLGGVSYSVVRALIGAAEGKIDAAAITELHTIEEMGLPFILNMPGISFPLMMIAMGITLGRTGAVSALTSLGIVLAAIAFPASRIPDVPSLYFVSDSLLLLTLGGIGLRYLSAAPGRVAPDQAAPLAGQA